MPLFSIIVPTYNRGSLLGKTIQSVLCQQFTDFELLIIDDGSTDNTEEVVKTFISDSRVAYFKRDNAERGAARNFGTSKATGQYINFFDSDDLMYPEHLQTARLFFEMNDAPEIFHLAYDYKTPEGELIYCRNEFDERAVRTLLYDNILSCNGVFVRKDIADQYPFEENRRMASAEDWALWIKLSARYKLLFCNELTSAIIAHDARSIRTINVDTVVDRDLLLIELLKEDQAVLKHYQGGFDKFNAERFTFFMLLFSEQGQRLNTLKWALSAVAAYPPIIFTKRFLASLRNILIV